MAFSAVSGALVIVDGQKVFWRGKPVDVVAFAVHADTEPNGTMDSVVRMRVKNTTPEDVRQDMIAAGIRVKVEG